MEKTSSLHRDDPLQLLQVTLVETKFSTFCHFVIFCPVHVHICIYELFYCMLFKFEIMRMYVYFKMLNDCIILYTARVRDVIDCNVTTSSPHSGRTIVNTAVRLSFFNSPK